jgi:hypothetical protein
MKDSFNRTSKCYQSSPKFSSYTRLKHSPQALNWRGGSHFRPPVFPPPGKNTILELVAPKEKKQKYPFLLRHLNFDFKIMRVHIEGLDEKIE